MKLAELINDPRFLLALITCLSTTRSETLDSVVNINEGESGNVHGRWGKTVTGEDYVAYEGIPYAEAPIGKLRFEPPKPYQRWPAKTNLSLVAKALGSSCMQWDVKNQRTKGREDCLFLNVYVPDRHRSDFQLLPVIFFIHGPDFQTGSGGDVNPNVLLNEDIILVTFNYRLGPLGFLTLDDLLPGNMGLKDQDLALRWVNSFIHFFGGDPKKITLVGHGAGGASVHFHYLTPKTKGLFSRGLSMSGTALNPWALTKAARHKTNDLAQQLSCFSFDTPKMVKKLKDALADKIIEFGWKVFKRYETFLNAPLVPFGPVIEYPNPTALITESPMTTILAGRAHDLPWITGITESDGLAAIAGVVGNDSELQYLSDKWRWLAPSILNFEDTLPTWKQIRAAKWIRREYFQDEPFDQWNTIPLVKMVTHRLFLGDAVVAALLHAKMGKSPVRFYKFGYRGEKSLSDAASGTFRNYGAAHGDDLAYITNSPVYYAVGPVAEHMRAKMIQFWATYAKSPEGKPDLGLGIEWPPLPNNYGDGAHYLNIRDPSDIKAKILNDVGRRTFWESLDIQEDPIQKDPAKPEMSDVENFYSKNQYRPCSDTLIKFHDIYPDL